MSDERPTKESPPAAFCSESVATIDTVKRPYCPRNPCAFFAALQGGRCAIVNNTGGGGNGLWHRQSIARKFPRDSQARTFAAVLRTTPHGRRRCGAGVSQGSHKPKDRPGSRSTSRSARDTTRAKRRTSLSSRGFGPGVESAGCSRCLAKGIQSVRMLARRAFMPVAATRWDRADFLRFDFLEDDMATFTRLQGLLVSTTVAALGSATMLALLARNALTRA